MPGNYPEENKQQMPLRLMARGQFFENLLTTDIHRTKK